MIQTNTEQMPQVLRKWPKATLKPKGAGEYAPTSVRVPGVQLPIGWSPRVVTLLVETPPGFPGAIPLPWFETEEDVLVHDAEPHRTIPRSFARGKDGLRGTRFLWRVQAWNPNSDGIHTLVRVCLRRFGDAVEEVRMMGQLRNTLENAALDWGRAYEAYDRRCGR